MSRLTPGFPRAQDLAKVSRPRAPRCLPGRGRTHPRAQIPTLKRLSALGFDAAIDYKTENVAEALKTHCPEGVNVYFDNVGGDILDAVLTRLARGARIVICGAISQYNATTPIKGPANYLSLLVNRASMTGIVVSDYYGRAMEAAMAMGGWMAKGQLKTREDIVDGLDAFPVAFDMLFSGANNGKLVLKVA